MARPIINSGTSQHAVFKNCKRYNHAKATIEAEAYIANHPKERVIVERSLTHFGAKYTVKPAE